MVDYKLKVTTSGTLMESMTSKISEEILLTPDIGVEYLKNSQHGVIVVNREGCIVLVNRSSELLFGYHKSEMLGQSIEILIPDNLKEQHKSHRDGFIKHPRNRPMGANIELKAKHKDGSEIPIDINLIPVPTASGMITIAEISKK